jgi:hypothetical protein
VRDVMLQPNTVTRLREGLRLLRAQAVRALAETPRGLAATRIAAELERDELDQDLELLERADRVFATVREKPERAPGDDT